MAKGVGPRDPYPDRPLEQSFFPDRGCEVSRRCIACPLMTCIDDELDAKKAARRQRDRLLCHRYQEERVRRGHRGAVQALAGEFGLTYRWTEKIIARCKKEER